MRLRPYIAGLLTALCLIWGSLALAQTEVSTPDFAAWDRLAVEAEVLLEEGATATELQLELMRARLAGWRETFLAAQSANALRIETLQEQLAALGPPPEEGATEPADIASRRAELNDRLAEMRAPRLKAEEAYNRANGLIGELDAVMRARTARTLTELGPSPLNPVHWPRALADLVGLGASLWDEMRAAVDTSPERRIDRQNLVLAAFYLLVALALLLRGRGIMQRATEVLARRLEGAGRGVGVFLVSLGQVAVPILGIYVLMEAVDSLGILGLQGQVLVNTFPIVGLAVFGGRWMGQRLFPADPAEVAPLQMSDRARSEGRTHAALLGLLYGLDVLLDRVAEIADFVPATHAVLAFPILVLAGLAILRVGLILMREARDRDGAEDTPRFITYLAISLGRIAVLLGLAGAALAAVGYLNAARAVVFPAAVSLALIGLLTILYGLIRDLYGVLRGKSQDEAGESLIPVLLSFALTLGTVPVFALVWGARTTDIGEVWSRLREGFAIGETRISPTDFFTFLAVFALGYIVTRSLQSVLRSAVLPKTRMDIGGQNAVASGLGYVGIFLAALVAITSAGIDLSNLAIVAGALSVGIGFGLQNVVSNFVSGIILLVERPISQGDWIEVGGKMGIVKDISVRSTRIETFDRTDVIVPNADLVSGTVTNWTRGNLMGRVTVSVGVSYTADSRRVEGILREICEAHPMVAVDPAPSVYFRRFGADALEFDCFCILRDVNYKLAVHSELNHQIHERFRAEGIEIPFAQRDLWLRNPEVLHRPGPAAAPAPAATPETPTPPDPDARVRAPDTWDD